MSLIDILDILMVAVIIYVLFKWIKGSSAMSIFIAILLLLLLRIIVGALNMKMMTAILGTVLDVGVIALIIIFQPEIRRFLSRIGRTAEWAQGRDNWFGRLLDKLSGKGHRGVMAGNAINNLTIACREMAEQKTGALIVICHMDPLEDVIDTGDRIDARISERLIENIFFKNSPLHDGAVIIASDRIVAARCTLPITDRTDIPARYGMRHKAAIGLSEKSDADVIVVSEQTGKISFIRGGEITPISSINTLKLLLQGKPEEAAAQEKA